MEAYLLDWLGMLLRWMHLIAGAAWVGASFYFVMLDNSLKPPEKNDDKARGVHGEFWAVHGGGFYRSQKYLTGPKGEPLTPSLHWSKWEAYTTWLSGMGLLAVIYWLGAGTYLIDKRVMALTPVQAIGISVASLVIAWLVYDGLCRLLVGRNRLLACIVLVLVVLADWALFQLFAPRAAYLHVGAMIGTLMVANVFFHIIPGQKKMVAAIREGRAVDPTPGVIGKQRSVHNTYFTLPVLFVMISGHYPMTFSHPQGWLILAAIMLAGVLIRQFFVLRLRGSLKWGYVIGAISLLTLLAIWLSPKGTPVGEVTSFASIKPIIAKHCEACHAANPTQPGFAQAPKGIMLQSTDQIVSQAAKIAETTRTGYMPLGNMSGMTELERAKIAAWFAAGATAQ